MCRSCGAIVAAGETHCGQCGAPVVGEATSAYQQRAPDQATVRFAQALFQRPVTFTTLFLLANVLLFLLTSLAGGAQNVQTLINFGAKHNGLINDGEWWRLVAPIFLHGGVLHLLMNMYGLWILGPYVERLYGSAKFVVFWILTGIGGVVASYLSVQPELYAEGGVIARFLFKAADAVSVGASGALFGLIGVLFVFGIKFRHELPEGFKQAFGTGMLPTILLNIFIGYVIPVIDNAAHLGGLVTGAALALFVSYKRIGPREPVAYLWHLLQAAALALVIICFALVAHNYTGPRPSLEALGGLAPGDVAERGLAGGAPEILANIEATNEGQRAWAAAMQGDGSASEEAIAKLNSAPKIDDEGARLLAELQELIKRANKFSADTRRPKTDANIVADFNSWMGRYRAWLETKGVRFEARPATGEGQPSSTTEPER